MDPETGPEKDAREASPLAELAERSDARIAGSAAAGTCPVSGVSVSLCAAHGPDGGRQWTDEGGEDPYRACHDAGREPDCRGWSCHFARSSRPPAVGRAIPAC